MRALGLAVAAALAGCQSPGPVDNPLAQRLTWFGYLDGKDIRAACQPGSRDRLRFVYNGTWDSQVRTYDVAQVPEGAIVDARVLGRGNIASVAVRGFNLLAPWDADKSTAILDRQGYDRLVSALRASGFATPPPEGRWLRSDAYFWTVAACLNGGYHWNAWASDWPREQRGSIAEVAFADDLLRVDGTGVGYAAPQPQQLSNWEGGVERRGGFRLQVARNGLNLGLQF